MSYASVAAKHIPPDQPHPDPALQTTEAPSASHVVDDTLKVNVVPHDFKEHPATTTSEANIVTGGGGGEHRKNRKKRAEEEGSYLWELTKEHVLRPGVAGGLIGILNVGLLSAAGYLFTTRPAYRRDSRLIGSALAGAAALLGAEGYGAEVYRNTPRGQEEEKRARKEGAVLYRHAKEQLLRPGVLGGLVGVVNAGILGTVGYFAYANWDRPQWDRRTVSAISVGLLTLWGGEGFLAEKYREQHH